MIIILPILLPRSYAEYIASNINNKLFPTPIPIILMMGLSSLIIALITAFYIPQNYASTLMIRSNIP